jgi:hypothetical protein
MLPIISPAALDVPTLKPNKTAAEPAPPPSPSTPTTKSSETPTFFDARVVARRDDGWEDMLERTLLRWTSAVVESAAIHVYVLSCSDPFFSFLLPISPPPLFVFLACWIPQEEISCFRSVRSDVSFSIAYVIYFPKLSLAHTPSSGL